MPDFYVYVHRKATDGSVFYVGKGKGKRAWSKERNPYWVNVASKHGHIVEIVERGLQEHEAHELEALLIKQYGRDRLCNLTDGGEGVSGLKMGLIARLKIFTKASGRVVSDETRQKISATLSGRKRDPEQVKRTAESNRNKRRTEITKRKMSIAAKGRVMDDEVKRKIKDTWASKEHKLAKQVACVDTGIVFNSIKDAEKWVKDNLNPKASFANISACASGRLKKSYGLKWEFTDKGMTC